MSSCGVKVEMRVKKRVIKETKSVKYAQKMNALTVGVGVGGCEVFLVIGGLGALLLESSSVIAINGGFEDGSDVGACSECTHGLCS